LNPPPVDTFVVADHKDGKVVDVDVVNALADILLFNNSNNSIAVVVDDAIDDDIFFTFICSFCLYEYLSIYLNIQPNN
jgi:hypothetical protein